MGDKRRNHTNILHLRAASIGLATGTVLLTLLAARSARAQTFTLMHSFHNTDGANPSVALVQATDGSLYGTTPIDGAYGAGTVVRMTPDGTVRALYSFCPQSGCTDGANPASGLVLATDGNLYGTTNAGGANGSGTVFKITLGGTLTTIC